MSEEQRRGRPANAFEEYDYLNKAYLKARDHLNEIVDDWNRKNPGNEVIQIDVPLMLFIHSCIPKTLEPVEFEDHSARVRPRMRKILYPLIEAGRLDMVQFANWISDRNSIGKFMEQWLAAKAPKRPSGKQPRPKVEDYIRDGFVAAGATIILRYKKRQYHGIITPDGTIKMDIGNGLQEFSSPNDVLKKGFQSVGDTASPLMFIVDESGVETCLQDIKKSYIEWKGL